MGYYVYIHTCNDNGKKYVGCTTQAKPEYRWGRNGEGYLYNDHFRSAILKHGWDNFEHEVFEVDSKEEMYRKEVELISFYHSNDPEYGYNNSTGGEKSGLGCIRSEEYRKKMSQARKGKSLGEEHRKHCTESNRRKAKDPEFRRKRSEAQKKKWSDLEYRRKQTEAFKGKSVSEEHRKKLSEAQKNRPKVKIQLPDGTVLEMTKQNLTKWYINKGKKFEYVD